MKPGMVTKATERLMELAMQPAARMLLRDGDALRRFRAAASRYAAVCETLLGSRGASDPIAPGYDWSSWVASVRRSFAAGVPVNFLGHPTLRHTMVYSRRGGLRNTNFRTRFVHDVYGDDATRRLLREDAAGRPVITDLRYLTSANRAHHAMHLAAYKRTCGHDFWDVSSVIEWGGGYGDMARLIRRMKSGVTYSIVDLPEIAALQYVYLAAIEGEDAVHVVVPDTGLPVNGKINLISAYDMPRIAERWNADAFVSTWAITESPAEAQTSIAEKRFFGAERVLVASMINGNNALAAHADRLGLRRVPIGDDARIGSGNEYWFR
jgi:hypothetical protein